MKKVFLTLILSVALFSCNVESKKVDYKKIDQEIRNDIFAIETEDYIYSHLVGNVYRGVNKCNGIIRPAKLVNNKFIIL
jgi:hypothetical protein